MWDLLENRHLFDAIDPENGEMSATHYVAEMVAYLGLPPREYIHRSETTAKVFDKHGEFFLLPCPTPKKNPPHLLMGRFAAEKSLISGQWKNAGGVAIPSLSLESSITTAFDGERKRLFLDFIKSMLQWLPEKRKTASELLRDPWLNAKCIVE